MPTAPDHTRERRPHQGAAPNTKLTTQRAKSTLPRGYTPSRGGMLAAYVEGRERVLGQADLRRQVSELTKRLERLERAS